MKTDTLRRTDPALRGGEPDPETVFAPHLRLRRSGRLLEVFFAGYSRWAALGLVSMAFLVSACPGAEAPDRLTQTEVGQEQLRALTDRVGTQLDAIIGEFQRNALGGEDLQLLQAIHGVLGHLSGEDMARVIELIQGVRQASTAGEQRANLLEAFSTQKTVGLKLRQILLEYQGQQELAGVAARLQELAERQQTSMRESADLAESAAGRKRDWLSENQQISLQLQVTDQQSLRDEVASVLNRLRTWSGDPDNEAASRAAEALRAPEVGDLGSVLGAAVTDLEAGRLWSVPGRQRVARGLLRNLAKLLLPPPDEIEALRGALDDVDRLAARQDEVHETTRELTERSPALEKVRKQEAILVDDSDVLRGDVAALDTAAGEQMQAAVGRLQEARAVLDAAAPKELRARRLTAATQQELAAARLDSARRLLQQRIDMLEKQRRATSDPLSNLRQVREDVAELIRQERELKEDAAAVETKPNELRPLAPRQGDLGDRADDTANRAGLDSQAIADQLHEAMNRMRTSQRSLGQGANDPGAQQAAIDALSKALDTIDQQLASLDAAAKELAQLEDLLKRLIAVIEHQRALIGETARVVRKAAARPPVEIGRDQTSLAGETREIEGAVPATAQEAATYLADAATQMVVAGSELDGSRAARARPPQDEALDNLVRARRILEDRAAQLKDMLGVPQEQPSLEELAKMIKDAQQDVNSALSTEAIQSMARSLKNANERIRPATSGRMGRLPRMIRDPLERADRALTEGNAAAEGGEQVQAQGEASTAQEALAEAAAAVDLAVAGMGQQPGEGQGQGGEGKQMGQGRGRGRGRTPGSQSGRGVGDAGNFYGAGGAEGPRGSASGSGRFIGLPARERAALLQSQGEHYPQEYAPMIEQYLKNLSDQVREAPR